MHLLQQLLASLGPDLLNADKLSTIGLFCCCERPENSN